MSQGRGALFSAASICISQKRLGCRLLSSTLVNRGNNASRRDSRGRLQGRACLITGGTSGIGYAIAKRFIEEGVAKVILVGRSETRLQTAAGQLEESFKTNSETAPRAEIVLHVADVGNTGEWPRALEQIMVGFQPRMSIVHACSPYIRRTLISSSTPRASPTQRSCPKLSQMRYPRFFVQI